MAKTLIYAHRGASAHAPENTMEAFRLGIEQGADGIELDVHLSKDGEIAVIHDATLDRTTNGQGRVCDYTMEELKQYDLPSLREVYAFLSAQAEAQHRPFYINVELKTIDPLYPELPGKLIALEREMCIIPDGAVRVIYSSFNHYSLQAIKQHSPATKIGLLYEIPLVDPHVYARHLQADAIHPPWQIIAALPQTVEMCRAAGVQVNTWTVNNTDVMRKMFEVGVGSIITDAPDVAVGVRGEG